MKTMQIRNWMLTAAVVGAVMGGIGRAGFAQVRQVQMGNALDANPGVGAGGSNRPVPGYVPISGNEVITGNVSGLAYFHGSNVGTFSPTRFQAPLGSAALSNFARQSAGGGVTGGVSTYYALPSAQVSTAQGGLYSAPTGNGFETSIVPRSAVSPVVSGAQLRSLNAGQVPTVAFDRNATIPLKAGAPGAVLSSPLFDLRVDQQVRQEPSTGERNPALTVKPGGEKVPEVVVDPTKPRPPQRDDTVNQQAAGRADPRIVSQNPEITSAMIGPVSRPPVDERVDDTYRTLLTELRRAEADARGTAENGLPGTVAVRGTNMVSDTDPLTGFPRRITTLNKPLTGGKGSGGVVTTGPSAGGTTTMPGAGDTSGIGVGTKQAAMAVPTKRLDDLPLNTLLAGARVKPLATLVQPRANGQTTPVEVLMTQAEKQLKSGKYLEAAQSYQAALGQDPTNVLALVGRAHAEMGAGMYQSGAYDLKFAFTRNPQMVSVRYVLDNFIPKERQDQVVKDLTAMSDKKESGNVASFLLSYIYYQTNKSAPLQAELKKWGERDSHDLWQSVVNRAWTANAAGEQK